MRFRIKHLLVAITAIAVALFVFEPELPSFLTDLFPSPQTQITPKVVVVAVDLHRGTTIKPEFLKLKLWSNGPVPAGAFTDLKDALDRTVSQSMQADEVVLDTYVTEKGEGVARLVKPGMRPFRISTSNTSLSVPAMLPSKRVDVLLKVSRGHLKGTLLQNVEILAVDQEPIAGKSSIKSVTLHVTPAEVAKLTHAQAMGTLSLTPTIPGRALPGLDATLTDSDFSRRKTRTTDLLWRGGHRGYYRIRSPEAER